MELNALTRWESIGKDLYQQGQVGREISRLKARSKFVDRHRTERQQQRSEVEETIEAEGTTPTASRLKLTDLEREEAAILSKWRALREKGKVVRTEEEQLEQLVVQSRDIFPPGHQRWVYFGYRCVRRFTKGFLFGYFGKFAFGFIGLIIRHKYHLTRLIPEVGKLLLTPELFRYGAFLGSFLTVFESCIRLIRMTGFIGRQTLTRHHRSVRVILSAIIAGSTAISFLPKNVRLGISMFFVVRALEILVRWMVEEQEKQYALSTATIESVEKTGSGVVAQNEEVDDKSITIDSDSNSTFERVRRSIKSFIVRISKIPASDHFDTLVMALASSSVIWCWLFNRDVVEPSYLRFLDVQGGRSKCVQMGYVELHRPSGISSEHLNQINAMRSAEGRTNLDLTQPLNQVMCSLLHREHESCSMALLHYLKDSYLRALPVYLPVYLLPMFIFKHRQLMHRPLEILLPTISNLLRSSLFLSTYCTASWALACYSTQLGLVSSIKGALAGFAGGLMLAIEKKGRRVELALYVLSQSLPATYRTLAQWKLVPIISNGESICFVAAMAVIMWSYVTRPHLMRSSYLTLFKFFFGSGGRSAGFSSRAVEHSATTKTLTPPTNKIDGPPSSSSSSSSLPILSSDPLEPASESELHLDGATIAASSSSGSGADLLLPRHTSRLSTVEDIIEDHESEQSDGTTTKRQMTATTVRKVLHPRTERDAHNISSNHNNHHNTNTNNNATSNKQADTEQEDETS